MLKYGIDDIRLLAENDMRFNRQFFHMLPAHSDEGRGLRDAHGGQATDAAHDAGTAHDDARRAPSGCESGGGSGKLVHTLREG